MKNITISEASRFVESADRPGVMVVRVIREGQGSSGIYTRELLEKSAGLFANSLSFVNHPVDGDPTHRTFLDVAGKLKESWFSDHEGFGAIYAEYEPLAEYAATLSELRDHIGLSIFTVGEASEDESGNLIVESFAEIDPYRSVDVVVAPGAGGSLNPVLMENKRVLESLTYDQEEESMEQEIKDLIEKVDGLVAAVEALIPDEKCEDEGVNPVEAYAAAADAIAEADLTDSQRKSLKARAVAGEDITEALAEAVALKKEISESVSKAPQGVLIGESHQREEEFKPRTLKNWSN